MAPEGAPTPALQQGPQLRPIRKKVSTETHPGESSWRLRDRSYRKLTSSRLQQKVHISLPSRNEVS